MKNKKELIKFLEAEESNLVKQVILIETEYRTITALSIANPKDNNLNNAQLKAKQSKEAISSKLNHFRGIKKDILDGSLII